MNDMHARDLDTEQDVDDGDELRGLTLAVLFRAVRLSGSLILTTICAAAFLCFVYVVFLRAPEYAATAVVGPIQTTGNSSGVRSALAAYSGVGLGAMSPGSFDKFVQVLHSARLAEALQRKYALMGEIFPGQWDARRRVWVRPRGPIGTVKEGVKAILGMPPWSPPTPSRFADYLSRSVQITRVTPNTPLNQNQTTVLSYKSDNRDQAVRFLSLVIEEADNICRQDQFLNSKKRVSYLMKLMDTTDDVYVKQDLRSLLVNEEQILMTVSANRYYAFDMIDTPNADTIPSGARPLKLMFLSLVIGAFVSLAIVYLIVRRRVAAASSEADDPLAAPMPDPIAKFADWARTVPDRIVFLRHENNIRKRG